MAEHIAGQGQHRARVSIVEPLLNDRRDILDGIAVASLGEAKCVFTAHRKPLAQVQGIFCDTASLTSMLLPLLEVLLAERGLQPELRPLGSCAAAKDNDSG